MTDAATLDTNTNIFYFSCEMAVGFGAISRFSEADEGACTNDKQDAVLPHASHEGNSA